MIEIRPDTKSRDRFVVPPVGPSILLHPIRTWQEMYRGALETGVGSCDIFRYTPRDLELELLIGEANQWRNSEVASRISSAQASIIFEDLKRECASEDNDESELSALLDSLKANGVEISVDSATEEPAWDDSPGMPYMEVLQWNRMLIGGWPVHEWTTKFWGYWGGGGTGWWTESGDSTLEPWLANLLEAGNLMPDDAEVPRP